MTKEKTSDGNPSKSKSSKKQNEQTANSGNVKQNELTVTIKSNKALFDILDDWKKVGKLILAIVVIVFVIFIALAFVTITIKKFYSYNDIKVNTLGATIMQNEDKEVIYWLFNSAELWANSGIEVEAGDVITVRTSGQFNTALHHIIDGATENKKPQYKWTGAEGEESATESYRSKYRLFPDNPKNGLLMQVVPFDEENKDPLSSFAFDTKESKNYERLRFIRYDYFDYKQIQKNGNETVYGLEQKNKENFYYIGKERIDLRINNRGVLHFAINDVPLTDSVIKTQINENLLYTLKCYLEGKSLNPLSEIRDSVKKAAKEIKIEYNAFNNDKSLLKLKKKDIFNFFNGNSIKDEYINKFSGTKYPDFIKYWSIVDSLDNRSLTFGQHPETKKREPLKNEMFYYLKNHYHNVWYDDNIGSCLIIIERKKHK